MVENGVREVWAEPHFAVPPPGTGPLPSPCPRSQGSLREGGLGEGGPPAHFSVPTREGGCFFNLRPRTRSSLLLPTRSRSASVRTRSSCWYGWWTSSGESFRPGGWRAEGPSRPRASWGPRWGTGFPTETWASRQISPASPGLCADRALPKALDRAHSCALQHDPWGEWLVPSDPPWPGPALISLWGPSL